MKRASTIIIIATGIVSVVLTALPLIGLHVSNGVIGGIVGPAIMTGIVFRARADPAYAVSADDEAAT